MRKLSQKLLELSKGHLEVRMPMTTYEAVEGTPYYYQIKKPEYKLYQTLVEVWVERKKFGYVIKSLFDLPDEPGEKAKVLGFAFTKGEADRFAHKQAVSLAKRITGHTGFSFKDYSKEDKTSLERQLRDIEEIWGGAR